MTEPVSVERREQLWRRHAEAYDDLLYGFMDAEGARRAKHWKRSLRGRLHWLTWPAWKLWNRACWQCWHTAQWMALRPGDSTGMRRRRGPWMGWWLRTLEWHRDRRQRQIDERKEDRRSQGIDYSRLVSARHVLSKPRFYPSDFLREEHFDPSDPLDSLYVGDLDADFRRVRREVDGRWE